MTPGQALRSAMKRWCRLSARPGPAFALGYPKCSTDGGRGQCVSLGFAWPAAERPLPPRARPAGAGDVLGRPLVENGSIRLCHVEAAMIVNRR